MTDQNHTPDRDQQHANAVHAAATWLQRIGADEAAAAVVTIHPKAAVGVWTAGRANVRTPAWIDDAGAELCEACAPVTLRLLDMLDDIQRGVLADAIAAGGKLQMMLFPASGDLTLRLVHGGKAVALGAMLVTANSH